MSFDINVDYDAAKRKLLFRGHYFNNDVFRSFPSRRFDAKLKAWAMPLVRSNIAHLSDVQQRMRVKLNITDAALEAIKNYEKLTAAPPTIPFPREWFDGKDRKPLEHQWPMLDRGWSLPAYALFAVMGTGKTFVAANLAMARHAAGQINTLLIICPQTLFNTWRKEFAKTADPDKYTIRYHDSSDSCERWLTYETQKLHVYMVGVEGLGISQKYFQTAMAFVVNNPTLMVVCDESSRIKNPDANRTKNAITLAMNAKYKMCLNGTPIALGLHDLWSQYEFLDPNIIGSGDYYAFRTRYVEMGGYENRQIVGFKAVDELMGLIKPYSLEVGKDVLNLPDKLYKPIDIKPTTEQLALFRQIARGTGEAAHISVKNVLEKMLRLQQVTGGFRPESNLETGETKVHLLKNNPKMDALMDVVQDHYVGSKFIIWARYVHEITMLRDELAKKYGEESVITYYGDTSKEDRSKVEELYANRSAIRFVVANPSAAGLGLTLISGENDIEVYYSGTFAYIDRVQSEDRPHRIGQKNVVTIVDLVMEHSIDVMMQEAIAHKMSMDQWVKAQLDKGVDVMRVLAE